MARPPVIARWSDAIGWVGQGMAWWHFVQDRNLCPTQISRTLRRGCRVLICFWIAAGSESIL